MRARAGVHAPPHGAVDTSGALVMHTRMYRPPPAHGVGDEPSEQCRAPYSSSGYRACVHGSAPLVGALAIHTCVHALYTVYTCIASMPSAGTPSEAVQGAPWPHTHACTPCIPGTRVYAVYTVYIV
jgi:hypothetical protein